MKIPEEYIHGELGHKERAQARQIEEDYTSDALAWSLVVAFERIATLTEQLEQANRHLNWLPSDQSFICSGCGMVYPNPHATDCPEVQQ